MLIFDQLEKGDPQLRAVAVGILTGMGLLIAGLWYVQVASVKRYRADLQEQSMRVVRVPAIRGKILDRNEFPLADNRPTYNVNVYLEEFRRSFRYEYTNRVLPEFRSANPNVKPSRKVDATLQSAARSRVVSNLARQVNLIVQQPQSFDEKQFTNHYDNLRSLPFPLVRDLSPQQVALFAERSWQLPTLALEVQPLRTYPWKDTAAQVIGHLKRENNPPGEEEVSFQFRLPDYVGAMGVELKFDEELRGRPGIKTVLVNNLQYRQAEEMLAPPQPGKNVILTLDLPLQRATEHALKSVRHETRGAAIVMDCRSGDILAMASVPGFDPNLFTGRISQEEWDKLSDSELLPQLNRATYALYQPGSIFKLVVALAGLESGIIKTNELLEGKRAYQINNRGRGWNCTAPPDLYDFNKAFYRSCNCYFIEYGLQIGFEKIVEMGRRLGLGTRTGLTTHQEAAGYFPDPVDKIKKDGSRWMPGDTANLSIGQGELRVTPLQIAVMTAAIANGGKVLEPRFVDRIEPQDPDLGDEAIRFPSGQIRASLKVSPKTLEIVRQAMLLDVLHRDGTGRNAAVDGIQVCGKTGTAQVMEGRKLKEYVTWFASFAPFDSPRYAVVVVVEGGASGGTTCAPVASDIYEAILKREQQPTRPDRNLVMN